MNTQEALVKFAPFANKEHGTLSATSLARQITDKDKAQAAVVEFEALTSEMLANRQFSTQVGDKVVYLNEARYYSTEVPNEVTGEMVRKTELIKFQQYQDMQRKLNALNTLIASRKKAGEDYSNLRNQADEIEIKLAMCDTRLELRWATPKVAEAAF